jgi:hypothetical protein
MVNRPEMETLLRRSDPVPDNLYDDVSAALFASILERRDEMTRTDVPVPTRKPTKAPRRSMAWVFAAAMAIIVVAVGIVAILVAGPGDDAAKPPATGTWTRSVLDPAFHARELTVTSFGLVAAAQTDGVWISEDGVIWRQAFAGPYEPNEGTTTTPAPPPTAPPPAPEVWSSVYGVGEFEGKLYAFGGVVLDGNATSRDVVWSSEDGVTWEETIVRESSPPQDGLFLSLVVATDDRIVAYEQFGSRLLSSSDGEAWALAEPTETGLTSIGLTDVVYHDSEFFALGESYPDGEDNSRGIRALYTSTDGLFFEKTPGPDFTENQLPYSLVEHDGILFAAGHEFIPELGDVRAAVWYSADGIEWQQMSLPLPAKPGTSAAHAPVSSEDGLIVPVGTRHYDGSAKLEVFSTQDGAATVQMVAPAGLLEAISEEVAGAMYDGRLILLARQHCSLDCDPEPSLYQVTLAR